MSGRTRDRHVRPSDEAVCIRKSALARLAQLDAPAARHAPAPLRKQPHGCHQLCAACGRPVTGRAAHHADPQPQQLLFGSDGPLGSRPGLQRALRRVHGVRPAGNALRRRAAFDHARRAGGRQLDHHDRQPCPVPAAARAPCRLARSGSSVAVGAECKVDPRCVHAAAQQRLL